MKKLVKAFLIALIVFSLLASAAILFGALYVSKYKDCRVEDALLEMDMSLGCTEFYCFEHGNRFGEIGSANLIEDAVLDNGIKYRYVSCSEIPDDLINAFIAVEDKRFYSHKGIDYLRTGEAALSYVFGKGSFGGSTITQQLVKNLTERDDFSIDRKLREAFSAIDLEKRFHKTEILEMYMNVINLSEGCRGVGAAAEFFYSKEPSELTLSECATIASITNNPAKYDPLKHPENNKKRRNIVLRCMLDQGYINYEEYSRAVGEEIVLQISQKYSKGNVNSWYIDMVIEDVLDGLCAKYGISRRSASLLLYRGGFRIYTAMDPDIQTILDEYYSDEYNFPVGADGAMPQASMIIIDPYNGDILGVAGAVGEKLGNRIQNYATQAKRPPGSTIKPLSTYAPALDRGIVKWSTVIEDSPVIDGNGGTPWPMNVTKTYEGNVDIKYAVEHSLNTVAVKVLGMVGERDAFDFLRNKLLINSLSEEIDMGAASLALGQPTYGTTLREITAAYSIFEEGIMSKPRSYYMVTDPDGRVILGNEMHQEEVISRDSAAIMTKLLEAVVDTGTASGKVSLDKKVSVAGKSGTSQNNCDRYFIGYTPELLGGVWFGYDYPKDLSEFGGNLSVYIWDEVMRRIYAETDYGTVKEFKVPDTVQKLTYNTVDGSLDISRTDQYYCDEGWFYVEPNK